MAWWGCSPIPVIKLIYIRIPELRVAMYWKGIIARWNGSILAIARPGTIKYSYTAKTTMRTNPITSGAMTLAFVQA